MTNTKKPPESCNILILQRETEAQKVADLSGFIKDKACNRGGNNQDTRVTEMLKIIYRDFISKLTCL